MYAFFQNTPFVRFLCPLICGILMQHYIGKASFGYIFFGISLSFFLYACFLSNIAVIYKRRWCFGCGVFFFFLACGTMLYHFQNKRNTWNYSSEEATYLCRIIDTPVEKEKTYLCQLQVDHLLLGKKLFPVNKQILGYISKDSLSKELFLGNKLLINTKISPPKNNGNPDEFDYAFYLKQQGISGTAFINQSHWHLLKTSTPGIKQRALICRAHLLSVYEQLNLPEEEKAILSAITLGYKADLSPELKERFSATGASHVLAVSGLHVGIVFMVTGFLLSWLGRTNRNIKLLKYSLIIVFLWAFAFITGLSPSVVRAVTMFSLSTIALMINRRASIFNTICASAFLMLIYNPFYLFDVGFQLSYSAVASIVVFTPRFQAIFSVKNSLLKAVWGLIVVSVTAQIGTFPFVLYYFHQFPHYFILTNIVVIPLAYLIIILSILVLSLYTLFNNFWFVNDMLEFCLRLMNNSIAKISDLPYASTQNIWFNPVDVIFIFILICSFSFFVLKKRFIPLSITLISLILLFVFHVQKINENENQSYITFFSQRKQPVINLVAGKGNYVLTADMQSALYSGKNMWQKNKLNKPIFLTFSFQNETVFYHDQFICFGEKTIFVLTDNSVVINKIETPFPIDYLLLGNGFTGSIKQISPLLSAKLVVLDASLPQYIAKRLQEECESQQIPYYDIAKEGAFTVDCKKASTRNL